MKQATVAKQVNLSGIGLHTGIEVHLVINEAKEDTGIIFIREIEGEKTFINANANNVNDTSRGTCIEKNGIVVKTIEHLMASFTALGIDNAYVEVSGEELPIMDGSAAPFFNALKAAGVKELAKEKKIFSPQQNISFYHKETGAEFYFYPAKNLQFTCMVDYQKDVLGTQWAKLNSFNDFEKELSPCKTFCFLSELEPLFKYNLIKGGDLDNAIVYVDKKMNKEEMDRISALLNKPSIELTNEGTLDNSALTYSNDAARHKLMDFIGDISLCETDFIGHFYIKKPGHFANTEFAKFLLTQIS